jgi:hypothetical protein
MPDFEIRYYHADGKLALVHMCIQETPGEAHKLAQINLKDYARFEVRHGHGRKPPSP